MLRAGRLCGDHRLCLTKGLGLLEQSQGSVIVLALKAGRQEGVAIVRARLDALLLHAFPQPYGTLHLSRLHRSMQADSLHGGHASAASLTGNLTISMT